MHPNSYTKQLGAAVACSSEKFLFLWLIITAYTNVKVMIKYESGVQQNALELYYG